MDKAKIGWKPISRKDFFGDEPVGWVGSIDGDESILVFEPTKVSWSLKWRTIMATLNELEEFASANALGGLLAEVEILDGTRVRCFNRTMGSLDAGDSKVIERVSVNDGNCDVSFHHSGITSDDPRYWWLQVRVHGSAIGSPAFELVENYVSQSFRFVDCPVEILNFAQERLKALHSPGLDSPSLVHGPYNVS